MHGFLSFDVLIQDKTNMSTAEKFPKQNKKMMARDQFFSSKESVDRRCFDEKRQAPSKTRHEYQLYSIYSNKCNGLGSNFERKERIYPLAVYDYTLNEERVDGERKKTKPKRKPSWNTEALTTCRPSGIR